MMFKIFKQKHYLESVYPRSILNEVTKKYGNEKWCFYKYFTVLSTSKLFKYFEIIN